MNRQKLEKLESQLREQQLDYLEEASNLALNRADPRRNSWMAFCLDRLIEHGVLPAYEGENPYLSNLGKSHPWVATASAVIEANKNIKTYPISNEECRNIGCKAWLDWNRLQAAQDGKKAVAGNGS